MRHLKRSITHLTCLLAENRTDKSLLRGKLGFALRRNLADQNIAGTDFRTDADNTVVVEILERIIADTRNISCNLFRSELGVSRLGLILLNMQRSIDIFLYKTLADKDSVLVVVAFPCHEADQRVLAKAELTVLRGRTVRNDLALFHMIAVVHGRLLVVAVALVASLKLDEMIFTLCPVVVVHTDRGRINEFYCSGLLCNYAVARVLRCLRLKTSTDDRSFRSEKRNRLTLHVGTHQSTCRVIRLKERNKCGSDREDHSRRDIHEIECRSREL